mmetsp:Transcript_24567/g.52939  ORF Transcript_24567/g.52939 Transcript_24567/m.52939 type:complete len:1002 (+) Transcript_24567:237-3242(+)|eukprot:CAMPEP_0172297128 /NCGR_PEP_ID=MMETSP1058-20130122/263_1 /TAXON_ID=83371 /ORGANISM="Detonula confervacea, Strain CCMP 353" /LENGTH=1001 /DNA_ID=CAMNT_0013006239 /DNA_START=232 /DNA_END=3237 /DNA_ORIENTATION=-
MKFSLASMAISATTMAAIYSPIISVSGTNFIIIQPDDMHFYEDWNPPAHLPWTSATYPGKEFPQNSNLPWINKLRSDGMEMTQAYAASPKCGTSRYSTVTGRYASRSSNSRKNAWQNDMFPSVASIPNTKLKDVGQVVDGQDCSTGNIAQVFQKNSYITGMVGKWHLTKTNTVGNTVEGVKAEIQECGFMDVEAMYPENLDTATGWSAGIHHNMEYVAYKAVEFIQDNEANDWFLYVNPTVPHGPDVLPAMDEDCRMTVDGDFTSNPTGWSVIGMTAEHGDDCVAYRDDVKARAGTSTSNADLGSIWVDDAIGAIYQALNRTNQLEDTVILFQLDHGQAEKDKIWEGGIRIPQFVHWPAGELPSSFDGMVSTIDIGPTMLDIAAATDLYDMDGKSWKEAVHNTAGSGDNWRANRCLFFESGQDRAVRCGCDKYMLLSSDSPEAAEAISSGWWDADTTEALIDLCDSSTRSYITADPADESPEAINQLLDEPQKAADLADLLQCHLERTDARTADVTAPLYEECTAEIATPSPTVTPKPTLPVANNGGVPLYIDSSPWEYDILTKDSSTILSATVLDDNISKVRFNLRLPNGSMTGFSQGNLVSSNGDLVTYEKEVDTTSGHGKYGYRLNMMDADDNDIDYPEDGSWIEFVVADTEAELVDGARTEIESIILAGFQADTNLAAKFVRHGFHDCVGGCDGCVDMDNGDNAGLDIPIAALEPVVNMFTHYGMTRADIWVLAALEGARGTLASEDMANHSFDMEWIGRPTCEDLNECADEDSCAQDSGPHRDLPSPNLDTHDLLEYFSAEFGFDERDTVAIMGAHTLGALARENSGFDGTSGWVGRSRDFDNVYYSDLVGGTDADSDFEDLMDGGRWQMAFVDNSDLTTPDRWQWERGTDSPFVMVNSDIALVRNLTGEIGEDGEVANCQFRCTRTRCTPARCPHAEETFDIVTEYAFDNEAFLIDFEDAFKRMLNKGFDSSAGCLSPPCEVQTITRRSLRGVYN